MLGRMTASLHHRGPDGRGFFSAPGIGLGMTRLSIVDIERGDQPISSEDGSVTVVCNGEIYNQSELRDRLRARGHRFKTHSDVEVIVHLYEDFGAECVEQLRGMFAFALWDNVRQRLMLARDRLGIKPLHYAITTAGCYFGSEQKAILASGAIDRRMDTTALAVLMTRGLVPTPRTLFADIRRIPPAHYLLYQEGVASLHEYWDLDFTADRARRSSGDWAEALREKLTECVRMHLMADVPVGAWLSPGIDSSAIVALMSQLGERNIPTFTLGFDLPEYDEIRGQRLLYDFPGYDLDVHETRCGADDLKLLPQVVWHTEDPVVGGVEIPRMLLARSAAEKVKVVLTGEGSDELLGGYEYFRLEKTLRRFARLPLQLRRTLSNLTSRRYPRGSAVNAAPREMRMERYQRLTAPLHDSMDALSAGIREAIAASDGTGRNADLTLPDAFDGWDHFSQLQYYEMKVRLPDRIESILDRVTMAQSLEARVPFLDHVLVEFCAKIPSQVKMQWLTEKKVLRDAMRDVLPRELQQRRKRGLAAPYKYWLSSPLPEFAQELLSDDAVRRKGYFDPAAVAHLRGRLGDNKKTGAVGRLVLVLMVQLWDEMFIQQRASIYQSDWPDPARGSSSSL